MAKLGLSDSDYIKAVLKLTGLSQNELGAALGVGPAYISLIKTGQRNLAPERRLRIQMLIARISAERALRKGRSPDCFGEGVWSSPTAFFKHLPMCPRCLIDAWMAGAPDNYGDIS